MSIRIKLITSFLILSILPGIAITPFFYKKSQNALKNQFLKEEQQLVEAKVHEIKNSLKAHSEEVKLSSLFPPIQGIIRSEESGIDPFDGSTLQEWKSRLESIFVSMSKTNTNLLQLRYLNSKGDELIRINSREGIQDIVRNEQLQNKANRDYFIESMKLSKGQVYISPMSLNQEQGQIETPHTAVLRFSTAIFDERDGSVKGIVVINILAQQLLNTIAISGEISDIILTDQNGNFLLHSDQNKAFSHEIGGNHNYFTEQPELTENIAQFDKKAYHDKEENEFRTWEKVLYDSKDKSNYWILYSVVKEESLFAPIIAIRNFLLLAWLITAIFIILISILLANSIASPIQRITQTIDEISKGNLNVDIDPKLLHAKDETGLLAQAFNRTLIGLKMAMKNSHQNESKSEEVQGDNKNTPPNSNNTPKDIQIFR